MNGTSYNLIAEYWNASKCIPSHRCCICFYNQTLMIMHSQLARIFTVDLIDADSIIIKCVPQTAYSYDFNVGCWPQSCTIDLVQTQWCVHFDNQEQKTPPPSHKYRTNGPWVVIRMNTIAWEHQLLLAIVRYQTCPCYEDRGQWSNTLVGMWRTLLEKWNVRIRHFCRSIISRVATIRSVLTAACAKSVTDWILYYGQRNPHCLEALIEARSWHILPQCTYCT